MAEWQAYGVDRYGVNVALGELDRSAGLEVHTGAGQDAAYDPHVRGWNCDGTTLVAMEQIDYYDFDPGEVTHGVKPAGLKAGRR